MSSAKIPLGWIPDGNGGYSKPKKSIGLTYSGDVSREAELHADILAECKKRGWITFHGAMSQATGRTLGEPDFTVLADKGRVFFIECKTKTGKLSTEQLGIKQWAENLGHQVHIIRSMDEFNALVAGTLREFFADKK